MKNALVKHGRFRYCFITDSVEVVTNILLYPFLGNLCGNKVKQMGKEVEYLCRQY